MFLVLSLLACRVKPPDLTWNQVDEVRGSDARSTVPLSHEELEALIENFSRVHFETDSNQLGPGGTAALQANAEILRRHPDVRVQVEGHADERGTVDYNLALGQRRANAVIQQLTAFGVSPIRLDLTSFGEEKPLVAGGTEVAWAENRRAEFRVLTGARVAGTVE